MKKFGLIALTGFFLFSCQEPPVHLEISQQTIARVDSMADVPYPLKIIDYKAMALNFDKLVYNFNATGDYWPLIWVDSSQHNYPQNTIGIYTAMGDVRQGPNRNSGMFHEAVATMGAVLGASLVGIDKSSQQGKDYVSMLKNYFNRETGWNIMMNNTAPEVAALGGGYARDWWYDVFPNVLFYGVYDQYPNQPGFDTIARSIANKFYLADSVLNGNYDYSFFNYSTLQPVNSEICKQQDAAAGQAYVLYMAYQKFKDPRYLKGAFSAQDALENQPINPSYEVLMPFGAYMAARLNAEQGKNYDVKKMLEWSMDGTAVCREGWGFLVGKWNGFDISGIVGSTVDHGGYGFLMNTYDAAWPLIPLVRYDQSFANLIGKWMLNAANAARLFYPQYMPSDHQSLPHYIPAYNQASSQYSGITKGVIAYEGIVKQATYPEYSKIPAPVAQGDGPKWIKGNPDVSQFSVYGSAHVGIFGSIIETTDVDGILRLNLLATDFYHDKAYPTFLYYNPYTENKKVTVNSESNTPIDLYDTISGTFVAHKVSDSYVINIPGKSSLVIVQTPAGKEAIFKGKKMLIEGVVVDYNKNL